MLSRAEHEKINNLGTWSDKGAFARTYLCQYLDYIIMISISFMVLGSVCVLCIRFAYIPLNPLTLYFEPQTNGMKIAE